VPKRNYGFEKRQKELAKQEKRAAKQQRRLDRTRPADLPPTPEPDRPVVPDHVD
jgi:hypothetical protein